jgi:hypothetical protein
MDIFGEKHVLPDEPGKKPVFNLPAGSFNETWVIIN